jgi:acetoacetyl-CoA synthetase
MKPDAQILDFMAATAPGVRGGHAEIHDWSLRDPQAFWLGLLRWSKLRWSGSAGTVCQGEAVETATFFPNLMINYADNLLSPIFDDDAPAITAISGDKTVRLSRGGLRERVEQMAGSLRRLGLRPGDHVAAVTRNDAEAVVAALAVTALGGVYATAAPGMSAAAIVDRFNQVEPVFLFAGVDATDTEATDRIAELTAMLPSLREVVWKDRLPPLNRPMPASHELDQLLKGEPLKQDEWPRLPFNHPLFILFSSGTTGRPKCIVHGTGGTLLEQVKEHRLHCDLGPSDILFFQTNCAWMMWHWQLSVLASGSEIVVHEGVPSDIAGEWRIVAEQGVTVFGTNPTFLRMSELAGFHPGEAYDLSPLRAILSTGSIILDAQFDWVRARVRDVPLQSMSGGTDILGCFLLGSPILPVHAGELQCRSLGLDVRALGATEDDPIGELVCANPFPSRPVGFIGDPDGRRFHDSYFAQNPGLWTHGDLVSFSADGGARIHGRSDGTLNVRGIRVGPAEIYRILFEQFPEISGAMAVEQRDPERFPGGRLVLLVVLHEGIVLNEAFKIRIRRALTAAASTAHAPHVILQVVDLPVTHSGKQSETAMSDAISGRPVRNLAALRNPEAIALSHMNHALLFSTANSGSTGGVSSPQDPEGLETALSKLWADILSVSHVDPDDDFFELGGDSLSAVTLFIAIHEMTGINLLHTTIISAPTIRKLVLELTRFPRGDKSRAITYHRGSHRPFFWMHDNNGSTFFLNRFVKDLPVSRTIIGIEASPLLANANPQGLINRLSSEYAELIKAEQPCGPYSLGGHSFGALLAYETALRLHAASEKVETLILVDPLIHWRQFGMRRLLLYLMLLAPFHIRNTLKQSSHERWEFFVRRIVGWFDVRGKRMAGQTASSPLHAVGEAAWMSYIPSSPYPGTATYVAPCERWAMTNEAAWSRLVEGGLTFHFVPGDHLTMMRDTAWLARLINTTQREQPLILSPGFLEAFDRDREDSNRREKPAFQRSTQEGFVA